MTTGEKAKVKFKQCGWFSKGWHEIEGIIHDKSGTPVINLSGKWNESISVSKIQDWKAAIVNEKPESDFLKDSSVSINENSKKDKEDKKSKKSKKGIKGKLTKSSKKTKKVEDHTALWKNTIQPLPPTDPRVEKVKHHFYKGWTDMTFKLVGKIQNKHHIFYYLFTYHCPNLSSAFLK